MVCEFVSQLYLSNGNLRRVTVEVVRYLFGMMILISAFICSYLACGQLIIRQKEVDFMRTLKEGFEVLDVKFVTSAVSFDQSDDKKGIVFLKDLLLSIIMKEIFIECGSIDVPIIEEIHLTEPFLQIYL